MRGVLRRVMGEGKRDREIKETRVIGLDGQVRKA
jgi:hypothetical protein